MRLPDLSPEQRADFRRRFNAAIEAHPERYPALVRFMRDGPAARRRRWTGARPLLTALMVAALIWALGAALVVSVGVHDVLQAQAALARARTP